MRRSFRFAPTTLPPSLLRNRLVRWCAFLTGTALTVVGVLILGVYLMFAPTVPVFESLADYRPKLGARVYASDHQLVGEFAAERRVMVPFEKIPKRLLQAFVSAEDKRFWVHGGVDFIGVAQAVLDKVLHPDAKLRGASTITQQVAKSLLATRESYEAATERSFVRKIREAILARRLEYALTKEEILYVYVHQIFLGHKAYGVQAAAEHYFRKNVWELSLAEMATLAGLPQRPSDYSPHSRPEAARSRRKYVLRRMFEEGYITTDERELALKETLKTFPKRELYLEIAPHYTEQVRREIINRYGERALLEDGLEIYTSLDVGAQHRAQQAIARGLRALDRRQGYRGPLARLANESERAHLQLAYREHLDLKPGDTLIPEPGERYVALVTGFDAEGTAVQLDVAGTEGVLPLAGMRWARRPDPTQRVDLHYVKDVRRVFRVGDVVWVQATTRAKLQRDRHGWEAHKTIPKEGNLFALEQEPIAQAALISVEPNSGYVVALVGGYDFDGSTFNRAVQACREPGSAFKPVVYSAAIDRLDYTASTMIDDKPIIFDDPENEMRWKPGNAGMEFRGQLPLRTALKESINTPAIRVAEAVGIDDIIENAHALGISTPLKRELGTALGSSCTTLSDLINVYVTLNQYGQRKDKRFIRRIVDRYGNVLEEHSVADDATLSLHSRINRAYHNLLSTPEQVVDEQTAFLTVSLLKNVVEEGTGIGASRLGHVVAGKTGTTNDAYDAWFMGFTKQMVTGVWVGHDKKERPLGVNEQGGRTALPIWVDFTRGYLTDYASAKPTRKEQGDFAPPPGVVRVAIDPDTGLLARPNAPRQVMEYYRAGSQPTEYTPDATVMSPDQIDLFNADTPL